MQLFHVYLHRFRCKSLLKCVSQPKIAKKSIKNPILASKVIEFGGNREPVYDFLLVINSNIGPNLHHFWDTATYWLKSQFFSTPLSFSTLCWRDPCRIYGKALLNDLVMVACTVYDTGLPMWRTDGQMDRWTDRQSDGQTDRIAMAKMRFSSTCCRV